MTIVPALFALAVLACPTLAVAEPPPPPPMPACDAPSGAESVERQYQTMTMSPFERGVLKIGPVKDLGIFPPGPNPYATETMFVKAIRYCEAKITLPDGTVDPTYWAILLTFNIRSWLTPSTYCSLKHDIVQDGCKRTRPPGS